MPGALKKKTVTDHELIEIFYVDHCWTHTLKPPSGLNFVSYNFSDSRKSVYETPDVEFFTVVPLL